MGTIWVLVANQAEAEIYSMSRLRGPLTRETTLMNEIGKAHLRDLVSDAPGRVHDRFGPARHSMEPDVGMQKDELRRFAKKIIGHLQSAHRQGAYQRLVLVAAPAFLGLIRKAMTEELTEIVVEEIPKDMVGQDAEKIQAHFS